MGLMPFWVQDFYVLQPVPDHFSDVYISACESGDAGFHRWIGSMLNNI